MTKDRVDPTKRFSDRVADYVAYRPGYPPEVADLFRTEMGIGPASAVADVGAGTGISSKVFLDMGCTVYGVEPNDEMRASAARLLGEHPAFHPIAGKAEQTTLQDSSVDLVTAAQAFHWFEPAATRKEFIRILKPGGWIALLWNERGLNETPFLAAYEKVLLKFSKDYAEVRHDRINEGLLQGFFEKRYLTARFSNSQSLDLDGLKGRTASSSYMPGSSEPGFSGLADELETLFANHNERGRITVLYNTTIYYAQF